MFKRLALRAAVGMSAMLFSSVACKQKKYQTYIWGHGSYQARPDALLQFQNFSPKKIKNLPQNLVFLHFGQYFQAGIDSKGDLYIWDSHSVDSNFQKQQSDKDSIRNNIKKLHENVQDVKFTSGYVWVLQKTNKVYQWPIVKQLDKDNNIIGTTLGQKRQVQPLRGTVQMEAGRDHMLLLNGKGEVYAMGDDTYGQCGQAETTRNTWPPFEQARIKFPVKVQKLPPISRIKAGGDHNLALDSLNNLYGWGSNSALQISQQDQFSKASSPLICSFAPVKITKNLLHKNISKIACGSDFSIISCEDPKDSTTQVFSLGSNLRGQLGIDEIKHFKDVSKIQKLSNYMIQKDGKDIKVSIQQLECGNAHCIALLNIGYVMEWGDNQHGQMGNKKRSPVLVPIVVKDFVGKKVVGVFASADSSGVIVEEQQKVEKPKK